MPPVRTPEAGGGEEPSTALEKAMLTPDLAEKYTMCSIRTPSEPVMGPSARAPTVYVPTAGLTVPGQTAKVRRAASLAATRPPVLPPRERAIPRPRPEAA